MANVIRIVGPDPKRPGNNIVELDDAKRTKVSRPSSGSTPVSSNINTGDPTLDEMAQVLESQLRQIIQSGNVINTMIEISPAKAQEFADQASREIDPYYQGQYTSIRKNLVDTTTEMQTEYEASVADVEAQVPDALRGTRDQLAERGLAQSGQRIREEKSVQDSAQRSLDALTRGFQSSARQNIRSVEQAVGSRNLKDLTVPTLKTRSLGGFQPGETALNAVKPNVSETPLFSLSDDVTGRLEEEQKRAQELRTEQLKATYREQEARKLFAGA